MTLPTTVCFACNDNYAPHAAGQIAAYLAASVFGRKRFHHTGSVFAETENGRTQKREE